MTAHKRSSAPLCRDCQHYVRELERVGYCVKRNINTTARAVCDLYEKHLSIGAKWAEDHKQVFPLEKVNSPEHQPDYEKTWRNCKLGVLVPTSPVLYQGVYL